MQICKIIRAMIQKSKPLMLCSVYFRDSEEKGLCQKRYLKVFLEALWSVVNRRNGVLRSRKTNSTLKNVPVWLAASRTRAAQGQ
jgi:hypothetical protein